MIFFKYILFFILFINIFIFKSFAIDYNNLYQFNDTKDKIYLCNIDEIHDAVKCGFLDFTKTPVNYKFNYFTGTTISDLESIKIVKYQDNIVFKIKDSYYYWKFDLNNPVIKVWNDLTYLPTEISNKLNNYFNGQSLSVSDLLLELKNNDIVNNGFNTLTNFSTSWFNQIKKALIWGTDKFFVKMKGAINKMNLENYLKIQYL